MGVLFLNWINDRETRFMNEKKKMGAFFTLVASDLRADCARKVVHIVWDSDR